MSIPEKEFNLQCIKFMKKCYNFHEHSWSLLKRVGSNLDLVNQDSLDENECLINEKLMLRKIDNFLNGDNLETTEYNVIYSEYFSVPVLYLCNSDQNGCPIQLENLLTKNFAIESEELGQIITQTEHPFLFTPFYMIHPCRTINFMDIHKNTPNYLLTWLTTVGTIVNLKLDIKLFNNDEHNNNHDVIADYK